MKHKKTKYILICITIAITAITLNFDRIVFTICHNLVNMRKYDYAIKVLNYRLSDNNKLNAKIHFEKAYIHRLKNEKENMLKELKYAIKEDPLFPCAYSDLGRIYEDISGFQNDTSLIYYQKAISLNDPHLHPYRNVGMYYCKKKDLSNAIKYYYYIVFNAKKYNEDDVIRFISLYENIEENENYKWLYLQKKSIIKTSKFYREYTKNGFILEQGLLATKLSNCFSFEENIKNEQKIVKSKILEDCKTSDNLELSLEPCGLGAARHRLWRRG